MGSAALTASVLEQNGQLQQSFDVSESTDDTESLGGGSRRNSRSNSIISLNASLAFATSVKINFLSAPCLDGHPFGEYRFIRQIGKGGFSKVFKGEIHFIFCFGHIGVAHSISISLLFFIY